ncbi:MAG: PAS domain-containing sensor histidine kinase, partial [Haloarcula sp.]
GENAFEYVHPDDREGIIEKFNEAVTNPEMVSTVEYRLKHKNGSWRWLESMGNNQLDNPAIEGFVVNSRDITDRKEKQRELQRQNERLERFASIISHDLRNPLSVAQGRLTLLRDECDSEQLDTIEQAHERMAQLINDVLSLARGGKPNLETDTVGLTAIAERSWQTVATDEATLQIETEQTIRADPSRLQQLFENLFRNAVEHGKNGVTVTVDCRHEEAAFTITDDGPGIPEDERNSVFKIGYSTTENGTGFGLPIVHEIVQEHEWEINVTESEDGGTRFEITGVEIVE